MQYFFKITNDTLCLSTYCGVMEFSAPTGIVILPYWLMEYMALDENSEIEVETITNIIKGSRVIFEPQEEEFFNIPEYDVILESVLSKFSVLHFDSNIKVDILDKKYVIRIKDISHDYSLMFSQENTVDQNQLNDINMDVIDIINTDLEVEVYNKFLAEKLEREKKEEEERQRILEERRKKEMEERKLRELEEQELARKMQEQKKDNKFAKSNKFVAFSGKGHRLGDK